MRLSHNNVSALKRNKQDQYCNDNTNLIYARVLVVYIKHIKELDGYVDRSVMCHPRVYLYPLLFLSRRIRHQITKQYFLVKSLLPVCSNVIPLLPGHSM